jgi:hypothetical protein
MGDKPVPIRYVLALISFVFTLIYLTYVLSHPYPGLAGGLFMSMSNEILSHGFTLPERIPHYTRGGIPFGYPPLGLYLMAIFRYVGVGEVALMRFLPGVVLLFGYMAYFLFAKNQVSESAAIVATLVAITAPSILEYTITAGGFVRSFAFFATCLGLVVGKKLFESHSIRMVILASLLFAVTLLTHLKYALFLGTSYVLFHLFFDRSWRGIVYGSIVAIGGVAISSPWWLQVISVHGLDIFFRAGATHGGIGNYIWPYIFLLPKTAPPSLWPALSAVAWVYFLARRELFFPLWFLATGIIVGEDEHLMIIGALMVSVLILRLASSLSGFTIQNPVTTERRYRFSSTGVKFLFVSLLVLYGVGSAALYTEQGLPTRDNLPMFVDGKDTEAMTWVKNSVSRNSSFLIIGDAAEWFPLFAERTSVVAPRGAEWSEKWSWSRHRALKSKLMRCPTAECISNVIDRSALSPDYIYIPRDGNVKSSSRGYVEAYWESRQTTFKESSRYEVVFRNDDVIVVKVRSTNEDIK